MKKYVEVMIDQKVREFKEEFLSEYLKKDFLRVKIEIIVDDLNLFVILCMIILQIIGFLEIIKGDILNIDIDQVVEFVRKKFFFKENCVEYFKKKFVELKEVIKEEVGENV